MSSGELIGGELVVGTDGSAPSLVAVRWAAREAVRRKLPVSVLVAFEKGDEVEDAAKLIAEDAATAARAAAPGVTASAMTAPGPPALALIEAAHRAALLAVGGRGHSGFAAALVGATSQHVAMYAPCPVVVVRGGSPSGAPPSGAPPSGRSPSGGSPGESAGPVVVGVDGSPSAAYALDLAYEQAAARRCDLVVVGAYEPATGPREIESRVRISVGVRERRHPGVPVERVVAAGDAAGVLVGFSDRAQLMVVGTRGHGGFAGLLLGSVALRLVQHAGCPVLVARGWEAWLRPATEPGA